MTEGLADFLYDGNDEKEADLVHILFLEKEKLVARHVHELDQVREDRCTFDRTLWKLRTEMLHLMQCDVELWKKLRELNASLAVLREDISQQKLYRARSDSVSSASSGTDSFVSAEEYNDVISSNTAENSVLLWIKNCDFRNKDIFVEEDKAGPETVNYTTWSRTCSDISGYGNRNWLYQEHLHKTCIINKLLNCSRTSRWVLKSEDTYSGSSASNSHDVFNTYLLDPYYISFRSISNMKSTEEIEIVSKRDLTYYKSSLRLLGSVRMQSRIFEPSLTKWRPFALSQTSDSYIIVPPKAFSNIHPRPKLHRLANTGIFNSGTIYLQPISNSLPKTEDGDKTEENEIRQNVEETGKPEIPFSAEHGYLEQSIEPAPSELNDDTDENNRFKNDTKQVSENGVDFSSDFLQVRDGLITCRIMTPEIEQELRHALLQQDEFEYLTVVDGRVTFNTHIADTDTEDSYFIGWLFENKEFEHVEESFYIHRLFEETDGEETDEVRDDFNLISYVFQDIQMEPGTVIRELTDTFATSQVLHYTGVDAVIKSDENSDLISVDERIHVSVNEETDERRQAHV